MGDIAKAKYREFLNSDDWRQIKKDKAGKKQPRCSICAATNSLELHHLIYRWPWKDALKSDLRWLCSTCHGVTHRLIESGKLRFPKPDNHLSCFAITKAAVKKFRGLGFRNMFHGQVQA